VVEMESLLPDTGLAVEWPRWSKPCIYQVPKWLKKITTNVCNDAEEPYRPRLVSLGPFHGDDSDLLPMEEHKRRAPLHKSSSGRESRSGSYWLPSRRWQTSSWTRTMAWTTNNGAEQVKPISCRWWSSLDVSCWRSSSKGQSQLRNAISTLLINFIILEYFIACLG
jgi:hypothetical protein